MNRQTSDYRRVTKLIDALTELKNKIAPPEKGGNKDEFDMHKEKIQGMMENLKDEIKTLRGLTNDRDIIEQKVMLRKKFGEVMDAIRKFGEVLTTMAKAKTKDPKARDKRVKQGHNWLELTNEELLHLAEDVKEVDVSDVVNTREMEYNERREKQKSLRKQRREKRRGNDDDGFGEGIFMEDMTVASEKEQQFLARVEQSRQEEEEMLQLITEGVTELHELAVTLNRLLKQSQQLIQEVDEKMDRVQAQLDGANKKMTEMLEQTGGVTRWCPVCICAMIILGCFYFIGNKVL